MLRLNGMATMVAAAVALLSGLAQVSPAQETAAVESALPALAVAAPETLLGGELAPAANPFEGDHPANVVQPLAYDQELLPPAPDQCGSTAGCGACAPGGWDPEAALFGIFAPSDRCFQDFISPLSNPLFFEDPRTLTEVRTIFAHHWIANDNPVFQGGRAQYLAAQIRAALSERLSIVANKDGYLWIDGNNDAAVPDQNGWADVAIGLKYNLVRDPERQFLVSSGVIYELDVGSHKVFQGRGDGEFHLFTSAGKALTDRLHVLSGTGFRLPTDSSARSQMWYWSNHLDYEVIDNWYGLVELNWFHWMKSGNALPVNFEGGDLMNLGSTSVAGNDIVTMAFGARKKFWSYSEFGVGYEIPLTQRKDLLQSRLYADVIFRF